MKMLVIALLLAISYAQTASETTSAADATSGVIDTSAAATTSGSTVGQEGEYCGEHIHVICAEGLECFGECVIPKEEGEACGGFEFDFYGYCGYGLECTTIEVDEPSSCVEEDTQCKTCEGEGAAAECMPNNDMEGESCLDRFGGMGECIVGTCTPAFQIFSVSVDDMALQQDNSHQNRAEVRVFGTVRVPSPWYLIDNHQMMVASEWPVVPDSGSFQIWEDCDPTGYYCEQMWHASFTVEKICDFATTYALQFLTKNRNVPDRPPQVYWYEITIEQGTVRGVCVPWPYKRKIVKGLLQRVPEAVDKTRNMVREMVEKINRDLYQPNTNYQDAEKQIIEEILTRVNGDQPEDFSEMMKAIWHLTQFYEQNGERREYDVMKKSYMKRLLRIAGEKHMRGFRAYLLRQANQIINEGKLNEAFPLDLDIQTLWAITHAGYPAAQWLGFVEQRVFSVLKEQYYQDGNPKPEFF